MRASTQHVQDRLNQPYNEQQASLMPIGTAVIVASNGAYRALTSGTWAAHA